MGAQIPIPDLAKFRHEVPGAYFYSAMEVKNEVFNLYFITFDTLLFNQITSEPPKEDNL